MPREAASPQAARARRRYGGHGNGNGNDQQQQQQGGVWVQGGAAGAGGVSYNGKAAPCVVCQLAGLNMDPLALPRAGTTECRECSERARNRTQWPHTASLGVIKPLPEREGPGRFNSAGSPRRGVRRERGPGADAFGLSVSRVGNTAARDALQQTQRPARPQSAGPARARARERERAAARPQTAGAERTPLFGASKPSTVLRAKPARARARHVQHHPGMIVTRSPLKAPGALQTPLQPTYDWSAHDAAALSPTPGQSTLPPIPLTPRLLPQN